MTRPRQLALLDALKRHEDGGTQFTLPELAAETGYKLSSVKTYQAKRFRDRIVFETGDGEFEVRGTLDMSDEEFLAFMDQAGPAQLHRDTRYRELLDRADAAMGLAVELFHRPGAPGGLVLYARLATEAWILLLGAELVRGQSPAVLLPLEGAHFPALDAVLDECEIGEELHHLLRGVAEVGNLSLAATFGEAMDPLSAVAQQHCHAWLARRDQAPELGILSQLHRAGSGEPSPAVAELRDRLVSLVPAGVSPAEQTQPLPSLVRQAAFAFLPGQLPDDAELDSGPISADPAPDEPTPPVVSLPERVLRVLREVGGPVHLEELLDATGAGRGDIEAALGNAPEVYRSGRATWIHARSLGLSGGELSDAVQWVLEEIEGESQPVPVAAVLREAADGGIRTEALTPWLLRDALSRHPDVVTFTNPKIIAHIESFRDDDLSLLDRLESIVREAGAEASFAQIVDALPAGVFYHPQALAGFLQGARWCVRIGSGRYCHVSATGLDTAGRKTLLDAAVARLAPGAAATCAQLLGGLSEEVRRPRVAEPARVLWGLLLADPRVQCGPGLRAALAKDTAGIDLLIEGIAEVLQERGDLGAQDLRRAATARYGYRGLDSFRDALGTAVDRGLVQRQGSRYASAS
jgi:hypothetical protein